MAVGRETFFRINFFLLKSIWNDSTLIFTKWSVLPAMLIGKWFPYLFLDPQALSSHFAAVSHWMREQLDGHLAADLDQLTKVTPTGLSITYWNISGCWRSDYQLHASSPSCIFWWIFLKILSWCSLQGHLELWDISENYTSPTNCLEILSKKLITWKYVAKFDLLALKNVMLLKQQQILKE